MHVTVPNWVSVAFVALAKVFLWWAVPTAVEGRLPAGGCVLVSNHANYADGPLAMTLDWHRVRPVAKPNPDLIVKIGFALTRTIVTGREVLERAIDHLRAGGVVWVAPEGRLNTGPALLPGHRGAARIAAAAGVPLVPLAIVGTRDMRLRAWRPWRRPRVRFVLGEPLPVGPHDDPRATIDEAMRRVAALLGQTYAGHPDP